ncbi:MAG: transporter ATPase [Planctomycetaceae bacterium]|nr:transporter ATPase [Planctomycetaceae bacterium]
MAWLQLRNVTFSYGGANVLDDVTILITPGERIGLMGRNGAGKSTLMKLVHGDLKPDAGDVERAPGMKIARLAQEVPAGADHTVFDEVATGLGEQGRIVARIHALTQQLAIQADPQAQQELDQLHHEVNVETGWQMQQQVEDVIDRMSLNPEAKFEALSSGMKRRVLLAQALVAKPDILLLDEPTNHLDIDSIRWLEDFLLRDPVTLMFVTHDRMFLQRLATRIVEVERGRLFDWTCDYHTFIARKQAALDAEAQQEALFDKKLSEEEAWIRRGVKARNVRNMGRVKRLEQMRAERGARKNQTGNVRIQAQDAERSGNLVLDAQNVGHRFDERVILSNVSTTIFRGDKIGILGPNGAGKSTLLRILLGELVPTEGTIRFGTKLQVAYFDQLRAQLDESKTAIENVAEGSDTVMIDGRSKHVLGYLQDFLFTGERARSLVRYLSGGERNRLLLAKMFTKPSNLLVLDEPTNDLDAETLELLEEMLVDYPGTLLVVSHDRAFLNNVVTSTLVFEGDGQVKEYAGGYDDWLRQKPVESSTPQTGLKPEASRSNVNLKTEKPKKLSFKEQKELDALPKAIEVLEAEQAKLQEKLADPTFYQKAPGEIRQVTSRLETIAAELLKAYSRWAELEP